MEMQELKDRFKREKDCYEAMFKALKSESKPQTYQNLVSIRKIHEQQIEEMQTNFQNTRRKLDTSLGELRQKNNQQEFYLRDVKSRYEKLQMKYENKLKEEEFLKRDFEMKYNDLKNDKIVVIKKLSEELGRNFIFVLLIKIKNGNYFVNQTNFS